MKKTLTEQIKAVKRELGMRQAVYPRRVAEHKMSQDSATHQIECLESVLETLESLEKKKAREPNLL